MNTIVLIFVIFLGGAILTYFAGMLKGILKEILFLATVFVPLGLFYTQISTGDTFNIELAGFALKWAITPFSYLFALIVISVATMAAVFAVSAMRGTKNLGFFYANFILTIMAMMGILFSRDLVSFFIFWEIMTWSSYLMVVYRGEDVQKVGIKYFIFSAIGAYAMLMAIVIVYNLTGSMMIDTLVRAYPAFDFNMQILIPVLLLIGFGVKSALMPLHVWAPGAYSHAPMAYTSVFSGALSKMGIYGMVIVLVSLISYFPQGHWFREVIAWMGGITAVMGTLWAIKQDDAKKLLAYSSVAQLGYIIVGVGIGTPLAMMSGLFLAFMHALFKGTLFMVVGTIEKQTGTTNFTEVTGLIRKMPWTFLAALLSIIALAGIPPLGGFIGKWMLYESLMSSEHYFLVIVIFFSSTAAFLYCYKFLFGFFLGQEEKEWDYVKEAPALMVIPMLVLSFATFVFGVFPGLILNPINEAMQTLGYANTQGHLWEMSVIFNDWGNQVAMQPIIYAIIAIFLFFLIFLTLKSYKNTRYVTTKDISSSGEVPKEHENLTFSINFMQPFFRAVEPLMKRQIDKYYNGFANGMEALFDFTRRIYTGNGQTYAMYVVIFVIILLLLKNSFFG
jgi:NADH-quinone oxidoreductase subunit M